MATPFNISLAEGLGALGQFADGIVRIDETIQRVETNGNFVDMPELLRVKGGLLLSMSGPTDTDAEKCFMQSLELSRRQGALAWELRTAVDLAALLVVRGHPESAEALLRPVFDRFTEGFDTADLKAARTLLERLRVTQATPQRIDTT
jgi:predicted ATPase